MVEASVVLDERSGTSCAVAAWAGRLHLGWTGSDYRLNLLSSPGGLAFAGKQTLDHRSSRTEFSSGSSYEDHGSTTTTYPLTPALAASDSGLYLAWTGTDRRLNVWGPGIQGPGGHVVLPESTERGPAITTWLGEVVLAWTGTDRRLNLLISQGGSFGAPMTLEERSFHGPAVCTVGRDVVVAWTGSDRHINVLVRRDGSFLPPVRLEETSTDRPALCAVGEDLVLGWVSGLRQMNLATLPYGGGSAQTFQPDARSPYAPALCADEDRVVLAWTGSDHRLNAAMLRL